MLCFDFDYSKIEALSVFLHYISHFKNGFVEVHFPELMPNGKLAKWRMLSSEFDTVYVTRKAIKAQALDDHLAENHVDEEYDPLKTYFHNDEVSFVGEDISEIYPGWILFLDGTSNN